MRVNLKGTWIRALVTQKALRDEFIEMFRYRGDDAMADIELGKFTDIEIRAVLAYLGTLQNEKTRGVINKINSWLKLKAKPGGAPITKLEQVPVAVKHCVGALPHKWLFYANEEDGAALPLYVVDANYTPGSRDRGPAHATIKMVYATRGGNTDKMLTFYSDDIFQRKTIIELLNSRGYYLETPSMVEEYEGTIDRYREVAAKIGHQFHGYGMAASSWGYGREWVSLEREGQPARVVVDEGGENGEEKSSRSRPSIASTSFWKTESQTPDPDSDDEEVAEVPLHPYVTVFDLQAHQHFQVHVSYLVEYVYDNTVIDKLVLPEDRKTLVSMLVAGSSQLMEDIVKGKTGGVVVICVGPPGTGKTLTAQVFSEQIERPLYEVQCSQLGTDEEALEKELRKVLQRATRWNAILLIDEADVYIHERGNDIHQNAIVGVFLRVLEAYRGVLFMTSNRATIIDDAILSRATAYIEYTYPTKEALRRIWRVLSDHYLLEFDDDQIDTLTNVFDGISGRRVKALIKLARLAARQKNQPVTVDLVRYVNQFLPKDSDCAKSNTRSLPAAEVPVEAAHQV